MITLDELKKELAELVKQREKLTANLHSLNGAIAAVMHLIKQIEQKEQNQDGTSS